MKARFIGAAVAVVLTGSLGGCATTGAEPAATGASAPHNHMRDNKQGYASPMVSASAVKPLHNHREFK